MSSPTGQVTLFNEHDFDQVFRSDLEGARKGIAIFSGFITPQRVATYEAIFRRKIAKGIKVRCVTRPPNRNGSIPPEQGQEALEGLEAMGCDVDMWGHIHQKFAIIDDEIVWFGSLNPLSYSGNTSEAMARIADKQVALQVVAFLTTNKNLRPDAVEGSIYTSENPRCLSCHAKTILMNGRYGAYWLCQSCSWKENVDKPRSKKQPPPDPSTKCPKCRGSMVTRSGPNGYFYGCINYPKCDYTTNPSKAKVSS